MSEQIATLFIMIVMFGYGYFAGKSVGYRNGFDDCDEFYRRLEEE